MIGRGSMDHGGIRVDSSSLIGDISNIAFIAISLVVDMLGTAIRKSNRVGSSSIASTITSLSSVESSLGVVISNSVGIGVRRGLIRVSWLSMVGRGSMDNRGVVSRSSMDNRGVVNNGGMVNWGSVDNRSSMVGRGSVDDRSMISWGSVDKRGSVVSTTSNRSVGTDSRLDLSKALKVIYLRHGGMGSSKCLGLDNASLFTIRSGH